jgi:hypothetical protein
MKHRVLIRELLGNNFVQVYEGDSWQDCYDWGLQASVLGKMMQDRIREVPATKDNGVYYSPLIIKQILERDSTIWAWWEGDELRFIFAFEVRISDEPADPADPPDIQGATAIFTFTS